MERKRLLKVSNVIPALWFVNADSPHWTLSLKERNRTHLSEMPGLHTTP